MKFCIKKKHRFSIRFIVGGLFLITAIITSFVGVGMQYFFARQVSEENTLMKLEMAAKEVRNYIQDIDTSAKSSVQVLRNVAEFTKAQFEEGEIINVFIQTLKDNPDFYSIYFVNDQNDYIQISNLDATSVIREKLDAWKGERWVVFKVSGSGENRIVEKIFYTKDLKVTRKTESKSDFYPHLRPWFYSASADYVFKTDPYVFQDLDVTGQSYSIRSKNVVIGIDVTLDLLQSKISKNNLGVKNSDDVESFIFNDRGRVIAANKTVSTQSVKKDVVLSKGIVKQNNGFSHTVVNVSNLSHWTSYDGNEDDFYGSYTSDLLNIAAEKAGITLRFISDFSGEAIRIKYEKGTIDIAQPVLSTSTVISGLSSKPIYTDDLVIAAKKNVFIPNSLAMIDNQRVGVVSGFGLKEWILKRYPSLNLIEQPNLDYAERELLAGNIDYIVDVYLAMIEIESFQKLTDIVVEKLNEQPVEFSYFMKHRDSSVLSMLGKALDAITPSEKKLLKDKWLKPQLWSQRFVPYSEVYDVAKQKHKHGLMNKLDIKGKNDFLYVTKLQPSKDNSDYLAVVISGDVVTQAINERLSRSLILTVSTMVLLLPIAWRLSRPIVIPILSLKEEMNKVKLREFDKLKVVDSGISEVFELSNTCSEMTDEIRSYEKQQDEFIDSFIRLIAQAIDDKSPYTAAHCNRVPELCLLIANAVENCKIGKYKNFKFNNDNERREFRIAAWLHDCGKITTPEHIVDKGTKLEANYNRIHEIRTRFEVLRRDAEVAYWKSIALGGADLHKSKFILEQRIKQLEDDFEFLASANIGSEVMDKDKIKRIELVGNETWMRYFDDSLGLSPFEEARKPKSKDQLPVKEKLLDDKPEHIIERERPVSGVEKYGINMNVPKHLYNLGERYNLTISRGTLTQEDRFKINEHMISGIKMLESLPFPSELRNVPRYASTHHETLIGTGYPRRLTADDLSVPERILAISDIFEALTAADRPYKKAKPVSVAVDIMYKMALEEHIDMDLFLIFLQSGVYKEYAKKYLSKEQLDLVCIEKYIINSGFGK